MAIIGPAQTPARPLRISQIRRKSKASHVDNKAQSEGRTDRLDPDNARADSISGAIDDFSVLTGDSEGLKTRRLILSYGIVDQMPDVPGFSEGWGGSIVPCPYCDGFEVAGQHWGLVWSGRQSHNQARLFHDWTDRLTLFADGHDVPPDIGADLARRNIPVVDGRITGIAHHGGHSATLKLDIGPDVAVDILFAHPRNKPSASLHELLGLATADTPVGIALKVDERRQTSMPGIYAAGALSRSEVRRRLPPLQGRGSPLALNIPSLHPRSPMCKSHDDSRLHDGYNLN